MSKLLPPLLALIRKVKSLFSSFLFKCQYRLRNSRRLPFVVWLNTFVRRGTLNRVPKNWNFLLPMICSRKIKHSQHFEWAFSKDDHLFVYKMAFKCKHLYLLLSSTVEFILKLAGTNNIQLKNGLKSLLNS